MDTLQILKDQLGAKYDVQREIGRGGMATVYLATDLSTGNDIAIKVLNPELSASITGSRFVREIDVMTRLKHPHILTCTDSGTTEGLHYYCMPFVRGESLRDKIDREGQLGIDEAVRIIAQAASALDYAHAQGVVHRDIKPDNLLLDGDTVLVADFGVARIVQETEGEKLTQTGTSIGTPVYMSPEQCYGRPVTASSDIYALGCVLYEMLVGQPPFSGVSATAIMSRHAMEPAPGIGVVRPSVPESVEAAYFAAMQKVPADRPKTATAFAEMMKDAKATLGAAPRPTGRMGQVPSSAYVTAPALVVVPWYRQPAVLVVLLVVLAGGGFGAWKVFGSKGPAVTGQEARRLAVLYFDNATGTKEFDYLADGLTESLINSLSSVQSLYVVSRGGAEQFRGSGASTDSIAKALDVGVLVRGSVAKEGDQIAVSVRLVDGASGADINRASVSVPAANPLALRDTLASRVAELIREQLGTEIKLREQRDATTNAQAWTLVQRAEVARKRGEKAYASGNAAEGESAYRSADSLYSTAAALDAKWPEPLAQKASLAYQRMRLNRTDRATAIVWRDSGLVHAEAALQRSADYPDALEARGNLRYATDVYGLEADLKRADTWVDQAKADLEKATTLNRQQPGAWATLSHLYSRVGSLVDANAAARTAMEQDPFLSNAEVIYQRLFTTSYDLGDFTPNGESYCAQIRKRFPLSDKGPRCELVLLTTKARKADPARARQLADTAVARAPEAQRQAARLEYGMYVAAVLARAGLADSARRIVRANQGDAQIDPMREHLYRAAFVYTLLGDTTEAIAAMKGYFVANEARRAAFREDPGWWLRPIANTRGFRALVDVTGQ